MILSQPQASSFSIPGQRDRDGGHGSFQELLSLENMIQGLVLPPRLPRTTIATNVYKELTM